MGEEIVEYIVRIHNEPYNFFLNSCIHKSVRIYRKAAGLNTNAQLYLCIAVNPKWRGPAPKVSPHVYSVVDGERIEVSLSPEQEQEYWKNSDVKTYWPVRIADYP